MCTFIKYFIIGVSTVSIDFVLFYLFSLLDLDKVYANAISVLLSMIFNFLMQNYWSFKAGSIDIRNKCIKYIVISSFNYFVNIFVFVLLYKNLLVEEHIYNLFPFLKSLIPESFIAKGIVTAMIMCWNFFLFKNWVFKTSKKDNE